jgi:hypothetical protein
MRSPAARSLLLAALVAQLLTCQAHLTALNITVPEAFQVTSNDAYVCTVLRLPKQGHKLVGVVPMADQAIVHHILLFGERPGAPAARAGADARAPKPRCAACGPLPPALRAASEGRPPAAGCAAPHIAPTEEEPAPAWDCMHAPTCARGAEVIM